MTTFASGDPIPVTFLNALPRENHEQEIFYWRVPISDFRYSDGTVPTATAAAGKPAIVMGGWGSGTGIFRGQDAQSTLRTEYLVFDYAVPECYDSGLAILVTARYYNAGSNTVSTKSLAVQAYVVTASGGAGANIVSTGAQQLSGAMTEYTFELSTTVEAGTLLRVLIQTSLQGSSGGALYAEVGGVRLSMKVRG